MIKIGTSSITLPSGELDETALVKLADDLAGARAAGRRVVLVMSGAIAAGMPALGLTTPARPTSARSRRSRRSVSLGCSNG